MKPLFSRYLKCEYKFQLFFLFYRSSKRFVVSGADGSLTVFENGKPYKTVKLDGFGPIVRVINNEIISAARSGKVTVMNEELEVLKTFEGTEWSVRTLVANQKYIAFGDTQGTVRFYDRKGASEPRVSDEIVIYTVYFKVYFHGKEVFSVDVDNDILVSGSADYKIQVWNMTAESKMFELEHTDIVWCVKLLKKLIVSCGDTTIRIWNLTDGEELHRLHLPGWCNNFDLNRQETVLVVGDTKGFSIWDFQTRLKLKETEVESGVTDVRFNESGLKLVVGIHDGRVWQTKLEHFTSLPTTTSSQKQVSTTPAVMASTQLSVYTTERSIFDESE